MNHAEIDQVIGQCYDSGEITGRRADIKTDVIHGLNDTKPMAELSTAALKVLIRLGEKAAQRLHSGSVDGLA